MESPSSLLPHIKRYDAFLSFHGPDVREKFLSHLRYQFKGKGITTFDDEKGIERSQMIAPTLTQAIEESRVSIVVLSKNYASSSWCLGELEEILKEDEGKKKIIMTIFYDVDPSDVRKQTGVFGEAFEKTCIGKTEDVKQRWRHALTTVANIAGEHSLNWRNENNMIEKIAIDVSSKLNATPSKDFDGMVGVEAHVTKVSSLLGLECNEVRMVGIWGPAGIGKTTIARALYNRLSHDFDLRCFMGNLKGCYNIIGLDDYDSKLCLQSQLLSKVFRHEEMQIDHLGVLQERLRDQRVLIILDDVDDVEKLEALAKEPGWFGPGSRIIVTTEDKKLLKAHGIDNIYSVGFPSFVETREIFCLYAFGQKYPPDGFVELAYKVVRLCGDLPLALRVVGSTLRRESKEEWELALPRLETSLHGKIEEVLRVVYEKLHRKDQTLFLHIACFFNGEQLDHVTTLLSNLDVRLGFEILVDKSLSIKVNFFRQKYIMMHCLLEKFGRRVVEEQSNEPGRRQFLVDAQEISDVLANNTGTGSVIGIYFDIAMIGELFISPRAFVEMRNLLFLRVYKFGFDDSDDSLLHIPTNMNFPPRLRLLRWYSYPNKFLPSGFQPEYLVELDMSCSNLQKLWEGIKPLSNLKLMDLSNSKNLKEIPNLSMATNLEKLSLACCTSLVELPFSIANLHKLKTLEMQSCKKLQIVPTNINLESLETVNMAGCQRLRIFPDISRNIKTLHLRGTAIKQVPSSIRFWSRLWFLGLSESENIKTFPYVPENIWRLNLTESGIKRFPKCLKGINGLKYLDITGCRKLVSLPKLPGVMRRLYADDCESLERVSSCLINDPDAELHFNNCLKLEEETRRMIIQEWVYRYAYIPGREVPAAYFRHRAKGNSLTLRYVHSALSGFKACVVISPNGPDCLSEVSCTVTGNGGGYISKHRLRPTSSSGIRTEHLFIFYGVLSEVDVTSDEKIVFEFVCSKYHRIIECGVQILSDGQNNDDKDGCKSNHTDGVHEAESTKMESEDDGNNQSFLKGRWNCFGWKKRNTTQKKQICIGKK